jgi:hypothetical protein
MQWRRYLLALAVTLVAVVWLRLWGVPRWQARELTPVMAAYFRAGAAGDSLALSQVTASAATVRWALLVHRSAPAVFEQAARLRPEAVGRDGDTVRVSFRFPRTVAPESTCGTGSVVGVQGSFLQSADGIWRLVSAAASGC